ncbi:MAG: aminoacyl-tRNA hydrolase [Patescibacteria group bacterium]|nr:aminoacyl-tRNA hydrolase [Patescibacteria group bacterium]
MSNNAVRLIVGLGNPGEQYERTWHNIGFLVLNALREADDYRYGEWILEKKYNAEIAAGTLPDIRLMLAKPMTMMNNSGSAVSALMQFYHLRPDDLWVVHDEIDLPLGEMRISRNASAAGHKGVQSIMDALGKNTFTRFRVGIGTAERGELPAEDYVLRPFPETAAAAVAAAVERAVEAITLAQMAGVTEAMNQYN